MTLSARTTKKIFTGRELIDLFPNVSGVDLFEIESLIKLSHPLPPLYFRQEKNGHYFLEGSYSHNVIKTIESSYDARAKRYQFNVIIFEYSLDQEELIHLYHNMGFC